MKVLKQVPWIRLIRYLPGIVSAGGSLRQQEREKERAEALQRIETHQEEAARSIAALDARIRSIFWIAIAALVFALAGLVVAVMK